MDSLNAETFVSHGVKYSNENDDPIEVQPPLDLSHQFVEEKMEEIIHGITEFLKYVEAKGMSKG